MTDISKRKLQHLKLAKEESKSQKHPNQFTRIFLNHRALPELDFDKIDTSCKFLGKHLSLPLLISSMTGGVGSDLVLINKNFARVAAEFKIAFAVGSQRIALRDKKAVKSFQVRQVNPDGLLFANFGAVQLNYGFRANDALEAVKMLEANALILHLNPLQEIIQPEGNRNFANLISKIAKLAETLDKISIPIILKEVGCGLSKIDVKLASSYGIKIFDIAGQGGTSWSKIEALRADGMHKEIGNLFADWGIPTVDALLCLKPEFPDLDFIASGGLKSGIDLAKSIVLGAKLGGMAANLIKNIDRKNSLEEISYLIKKITKEYKICQFLLGAKNYTSIYNNPEHILKIE